jgi:hypothetical protein
MLLVADVLLAGYGSSILFLWLNENHTYNSGVVNNQQDSGDIYNYIMHTFTSQPQDIWRSKNFVYKKNHWASEAKKLVIEIVWAKRM